MRILSFDIGSDSIKALELDARFGKLELADYLMERVVEPTLAGVSESSSESAQSPEETTTPATVAAPSEPSTPVRKVLTQGQVEAIKRLIADKPLKYDRIIINIPRSLTTNRLLQFPTKDRKAIQKSIAFELEDEIPVSLSEAIFDFCIMQSQGNSSSVYTAIALKKDLVALLSELQMIGLDPDMVTLDGWSIGQLLQKSVAPELENTPLCVVNLGAKHTVLHMLVNQNPVITHTVNVAGDAITHSIAAGYGLTFEQAEKAKVEGGFLLTNAHVNSGSASEPISDDQRKFAQTIADAMIPIVREMKQTLMSFKSQYQLTPHTILLTGGTSLIPHLALYLEEQLQIPVRPLRYGTQIAGPSLQLSETTEAQFSGAMGLALCGLKPGKGLNINFRKDEFEKRGGSGAFSIQNFAKPLKYIAASLAFIYVNLIIQYYVLSSRADKQTASLERAIRNVLGSSVSKSSLNTYINSPSTLRSAVGKEISKYKPAVVTPPKKIVSALEVLNKVSSTIPRDMTLDTILFSLKDNQLSLKGTLTSMTDTEKVTKALEETKLLSAVAKTKVEEDPKTKKVSFDLTAKVGEVTK